MTERAAPPRCCPQPRVVARGAPHRRHPAQGDRRRSAAAGRRRRRAGLGELAVVGRRTRRCGVLTVGPAALHLDLSLATWAADGLLAIFFFVAGLELKREFVAGDLRDPRRAAVPIAAAVGGVIVPAVLYAVVNLAAAAAPRGLGDPHRHRHRFRPGGAGGDRAAPAVGAAHVPADPGGGRRPARDRDHRRLLHRGSVRAAAAARAGAAGACSRCWCSAGSGRGGCCCRWRSPPGRWCTPPACTPPSPACCWASPCPSCAATKAGGPDAGPGLAEHFEHRFRPLSAGVAVPVFAFMSAGVDDRRAQRLGVGAHRPRRGRHRRRARARQADRHHWPRPGWSPGSPARDLDAGLAWVDVLGLVDARRHRVHRVAAHRRTGLRPRQRAGRPRQGRGARRLAGRRCLAAVILRFATARTGVSTRRSAPTATATASPTSTRVDRPRAGYR